MADIDLSLLNIEKIIVHDVPHHKKDDFSRGVDYSEEESSLTPDLKRFFKDKIIEATNSRGFKVIIDHNEVSPLPKIIQSLIEKPNKAFVDNSQKIAKHLYDIQKGYNPGGIVVVIWGKISRHNIISILKLERDEGAQLKKIAAKHVINIIQVKNLMLTQKTKLYKVATFFSRDSFQCSFDGLICDNQLSMDSTYSVAQFFLKEYLGCALYGDNRKVTKDFFETTRIFITRIEDPITRATYYDHLLSYMNRPNQSVNSEEFINYLNPEHKQPYSKFLEENNFDFHSFQKDNELIKSQITKMMIDFENDVSIISRNGDLGGKVKLTAADDGQTKAEIISRIRNIK
jgi:hypothetical protein